MMTLKINTRIHSPVRARGGYFAKSLIGLHYGTRNNTAIDSTTDKRVHPTNRIRNQHENRVLS